MRPEQLKPEYCRVCNVNKYKHGKRYTSDEHRDEIPKEFIPVFTNSHGTFESEGFHYYVHITVEEFKTYLRNKRNVITT